MYNSGEAALERILELVAKCPPELRERCFEILLSGYVQLEVGAPRPHVAKVLEQQAAQLRQQASQPDSHIPTAVLPRFKNTAKRLGITLERLDSLFDFSVDPFV